MKLSLQDAIRKADSEVQNKGQLISAQLEDEDGTLVYALEFQDGAKEHEVLLDPNTGKQMTLEDSD